MNLTDDQLKKIRDISDGDHTCPTCHQRVAIDRYGISGTMCRVLRKMAKQTTLQLKDGGRNRNIDTQEIGLINSEPNQLTKMRFLGLIAKVRDEKGTHVPRNWLITKRGWNFLSGEPVPAHVEVYDNSVLGTYGGTTTIRQCEAVNAAAVDQIEQESIGAEQAAVLGAAKGAGVSKLTYEAEYRRQSHTATGLQQGSRYVLTVEKLQIGKPVKLSVRHDGQDIAMEYKDVAAFARDWKKAE